MQVEVADIMAGFAKGLARLDRQGPWEAQGDGTAWQGAGSLAEAEVIRQSLIYAKMDPWPGLARLSSSPAFHVSAQSSLHIPDEWSVEFRMVRLPLAGNDRGPGDDYDAGYGIPLYADPSNPLGGCRKLLCSHGRERKALVLFGFVLDPLSQGFMTGVKAFEVVADYVQSIRLGPRNFVQTEKLSHPIYRYADVFGWEIQGYRHARKPPQFIKPSLAFSSLISA